MAMGMLPRLCLLVCYLCGETCSASPVLQKIGASASENDQPSPRLSRALSSPLIGDDGRLIACSGKDVFAFERNGSIAWTVPLEYNCKQDVAPITDKDAIYLVAEEKAIKITPWNIHTRYPASEVFFSYNSTPGSSQEIIGLSISGSHSSLFLTIRNLGLFSVSLGTGLLKWSVGPALDRYGRYRLGCKRNASDCYFNSAPVVDQCEGTLYMSNTEGQLYSLYIKTRQYRWIQDLSSVDRVMTIAPGNNGRLYVVLPRKSFVMGLDSFTGNISWQQSVGPLSHEKTSPTVDSNGWISIGSLDGTLYSISPDGDIRKFLRRTARYSVIHASPVLDRSGFSVYISQTIMEKKSDQTIGDYTYVSATKPSSILVTLLAPSTGTIYWTGKYPGELSNLLSNSTLNYFTLDETILLTALSASRIACTVECCTRTQKIAWTCRKADPKFANHDPGDHSHDLLLFFILLIVIVIQAVIVQYCYHFWRKEKLQKNGFDKFVEKRNSLHSEKRTLGKMISELEQKAAEDASSNEILEQLGEMVKAKECVERKLYTSYSLGRDVQSLRQGSVLPIYNTLSDTSTSENGTSRSYSSGSENCSGSSPVGEAGPSNTANVAKGGECSTLLVSGRKNLPMEIMQQGSASAPPTRRTGLKRRRTLTSI